jgi:exodeoxyribonuclease VII small subunit
MAEGIDDASLTFEQLVGALEELTDRMASGELGIEEATDLYERAEHLHRLATDRLVGIQERIEKLNPSAD